MKFGIYIHIPYCIQRCTYCDFATYEQSSILPPTEYINHLLTEIRFFAPLFIDRKIDTVYFGGGTPSLIPPQLLKLILDEFKILGFTFSTNLEVTIEINPATVSESNLQQYLKMGINRFSVGAQTFKDSHLKNIGREHNADDTIETLSLLAKYKLNFSFDILFALPRQTKEELQLDLSRVLEFNPHHVSPYCLTVPQSNPLAKNRATDEKQAEMFELIRDFLIQNNFHQYEISNFAKPGFESGHNLLYWQDQPYWGLGLSSHSYENYFSSSSLKSSKKNWGVRYWNYKSINQYTNWCNSLSSKPNPLSKIDAREESTYEILEMHQSLTDYCHTFLRTSSGINPKKLEQKFGKKISDHIAKLIEPLILKGWIFRNKTFLSQDFNWSLTDEGVVLSNQVFAELTFLKEDLAY